MHFMENTSLISRPLGSFELDFESGDCALWAANANDKVLLRTITPGSANAH